MDFVQRMGGGDQDLFRRAPAIRAGAAEVTCLDHRDREARRAGRARDAHRGVPTTKNDNVIFLSSHLCSPPGA